MKENEKLKVLFVSVEVSPFAKTGGLADVAGSLPQGLSELDVDIRVVMPRFKKIDASMSYVTDFPVNLDHRKETCIVRELDENNYLNGKKDAVPVYFIDSYQFFDRDGIYCFCDDANRFAFFCRAVLEMLPKINFKPDIIHCNDWHTGPVCMLLNEEYKKYPFYKDISTLFTIHNLEYQGNFPKDVFNLFSMRDDVFSPEKVEFYGMFSFMKCGLVYADIINTVSETYAREIQTDKYGEKMEGLLKIRSKDLFGIVNGISYDFFNPENDPRIYKNYNSKSTKNKIYNKHSLQKEMGLPIKDVPVIGLISRLTGQKGLNLIVEVLDKILEKDLQFVLLGEGDPYFENIFKEYRSKYPEKMGTYIGFNATLAQRIYAGSDMFLMPSRFEPCGLGQIISLRYGTIPIVRATGGLADTIIDISYNKVDGNGFVFEEFSSAEMMDAIDRALKLYTKEPEKWDTYVVKALELDFSWKKPAEKYINLYNLAIEKQKVVEIENEDDIF